MSDDLTERLRGVTGGKLDYTNTPNSLRLASADHIEQLVATRDELEAKLDDKEAECRHLRGQVGLLEAKLAKSVKVLQRIAKHDHQKSAINALVYYLPTNNLSAVKEVLDTVAETDIQAWAKSTLAKLKGQDGD